MKGRVSKRLREKLKAAASPPTPDSAPPAPEDNMAEFDQRYFPENGGEPARAWKFRDRVAETMPDCVVGSPLQSGAGSVGEEPSRPVRCLCGADAEYRKDAPQSSRWGDNPEVSFKADEWHCPKCGEVWFSPRMSDRYTTNLLKATIKALRSRPPLVSVEEPSDECEELGLRAGRDKKDA